MPYFKNRPYPAAGNQLPMPVSNKIVNPEAEANRPGLKRKQILENAKGMDSGNAVNTVAYRPVGYTLLPCLLMYFLLCVFLCSTI